MLRYTIPVRQAQLAYRASLARSWRWETVLDRQRAHPAIAQGMQVRALESQRAGHELLRAFLRAVRLGASHMALLRMLAPELPALAAVILQLGPEELP